LTVERDTAGETSFPRAKVIPVEISNRIDRDSSILHERGEQVWKKLFHHRRAPGEQDVNMPPLRYALASLDLQGKSITLDDRYLLKMVREDATGEQSGHARPDNNSVLAAKAFPLRLVVTHDISFFLFY
jgi:hypothetical protein